MSGLRKQFAGLMLCAGLSLSMTAAASAQALFQSIFPAGGSNDAARGGVLQLRDGGTISVGESQSFSSLGDYDVYVTKTNRCGQLEWATTYDLGGADYGRKIRQTEDGGYIIVGSTQNGNSCCNTPTLSSARIVYDIFLLKIDARGGVEWAKTYGGLANDEGNDVQIYTDGGYVVAGSTQSYGLGRMAGFLIRTNIVGDVQWSRPYGEGTQAFNSCTVEPGSGDIVAAGVSASTFSRVSNIFAVRTDSDGTPVWAREYPHRRGGAARSVITSLRETFVIGGYINSAETGNRDGYLLRIGSNGDPLADRAYAEAFRTNDDEIAEVREVPELDYALVFTGYLTDAPGGFGGRDMFLGEVDRGFNPTSYAVYGGRGQDEGYSISFLYRSDLRRQVITLNGVTTSFSRLRPAEDLYLVQAAQGGESGCNTSGVKVEDYEIGVDFRELSFCTPLVLNQCAARVTPIYNERYRNLCTTCLFDPETPLEEAPLEETPDLGRALPSPAGTSAEADLLTR